MWACCKKKRSTLKHVRRVSQREVVQGMVIGCVCLGFSCPLNSLDLVRTLEFATLEARLER